MKKIGLKFCGGCNPLIDRRALVEDIRKSLPPGWVLTTEEPDPPWEIALLVSGCPTACVDRPELTVLARRWVRITGGLIDQEPIPEDQRVQQILKKMGGS